MKKKPKRNAPVWASALSKTAEFLKKHRPFFVLILLWALTMIPRVYWLTQKGALHNDEVTSIIYSEVNELGWSHHFRFDTPFSGKTIKEGFLLTDDTYAEMWSDVGQLWRYIPDGFHLNLYFILLRFAEGTLKSGDFHDFIPRAGALNLILHTVSFFVFFLLARRFFGARRLLPYIAAFATFMSTAAISTTLLFRPYQLAQTSLIVFAYVFIRYLQEEKITRLETGAAAVNLKFVVCSALAAAFALVSSLFSMTFVACIGLYVIIWNIRAKRYRDIAAYLAVFIFALGITQIAYPGYLPNSVVPQVGGQISKIVAKLTPAKSAAAPVLVQAAPEGGEGAVLDAEGGAADAENAGLGAEGGAPAAGAGAGGKTIFEETMDMVNAIRALPTMFSQLYMFYWTAPVLVVMLLILSVAGALFMTRGGREARSINVREWLQMAKTAVFSPGFALFASAFLFVLFGIMAAAFKELRYGAPAYPFFILLPAALLNLIRDKRIAAALGIALAASFTVFDFSESRVPNVWRGFARQLYRFADEPQIPAFIIANSNHFPLLLPYLADHQTYIFNNKIYPAFQKFNFEEFYLIINDPIIETNPIDSNFWAIEDSYKVGVNIDLWTVGKLKRIVDAETVAATLDEAQQ